MSVLVKKGFHCWSQIDEVLLAGALDVVANLLKHSNLILVQKATLFVSKLTARDHH